MDFLVKKAMQTHRRKKDDMTPTIKVAVYIRKNEMSRSVETKCPKKSSGVLPLEVVLLRPPGDGVVAFFEGVEGVEFTHNYVSCSGESSMLM